MSAPLKRYDPEVIRGDCHFEMMENKDGDWLKREDVLRLFNTNIPDELSSEDAVTALRNIMEALK